MKTFNLLLLATTLAFASFGQNSPLKLVRERVGDKAIVENWKVGEVKETNGVKALRVEGENGIDHRTNVFYIPQSQILNEINEKASVDMVYNKELSELTDFYTTKFSGGQVAIFFDRISQTLADPMNFTIQIMDAETHKVLFETKLDYQAPYYYKWNIWYYYTTVNIPEKAGEKFIVRVLDIGLQQSSEFLVYDNFYDNFSPDQPASSIFSAGK